ncbi:peptidoglycan DD-metalloendopeptidase family protein [Epidermidibacterium keratini]|uniref:Peptidoglycan DD-metalloendopeptidase family protein n=1 Tax=Epidermidibacterium keratini TaxID=1891644 RepID=A0A7L4YRX8_9ACTN|nr:M23 family metallopeptidase [Epidermidibacterium keratini]QHC01870.1 peptidoglycan DD-metalloendopeptidase family protein [Epidermidibacterium keratini]
MTGTVHLSTPPRSPRRMIARLYSVAVIAFVAWVVAAFVLDLNVWLLIAVAAALIVLMSIKAPRSDRAPTEVGTPVRGRWAALNSPATKVPSHGTRGYGQEYAIDILRATTTGKTISLGLTGGYRRPTEFSSYGEPVLAAAAGTVVHVSDRWRDHRSRSSWPAVLYLLILEQFRVLGGFGAVGGNHVILDHGDGTYAAYAHLRRGSVRVRRGEQVAAGHQLAEVGNSGNTSEPHLHFQLMDHPHPNAAAGLPFRWRDATVQPGVRDDHWPAEKVTSQVTAGLPANGQVFEAP